ncbi:hypothetical protein [Streptomyces sp. NPDC059009]|uniref:hypothetical protein n=1 Tax=Streptomyces sp. NPDC059009 TaxID=3346694 RepID=UPI00368B988E
MPLFPPLRVRGDRLRLRRLLRQRRRVIAVGLAMTAAALAATGPPDAGRARAQSGRPDDGRGVAVAPAREQSAAEARVTAPVRIADAGAARLLRPGDRVDVIAGDSGGGGAPRVVAAGARVSEVPESRESAGEGGALVVLSVPRSTATRLAGAGATSRLAVTLC